MGKEFNTEEFKQALAEKEHLEKEDNEKKRKILLEKALAVLKKEFTGTNIEVYLVGSITRPYAFSKRSDIDIVVKGYREDRFDLWTRLETLLKRNVEVILYEKCHFKDEVDKLGLKVV